MTKLSIHPIYLVVFSESSKLISYCHIAHRARSYNTFRENIFFII